jgi:histidine ammonia-lyase
VAIGVGGALTLADVVAVARGATVEFPDDSRARVEAARAVVERVITSGDTIYGVTTGFGSLADVRIDPSQAAALSWASCGRTRRPSDARCQEEAEAMLLRAHVLALGYSGVRPLIVDRMVEMLNRELIPSVPEQGSLGASGDLAPLANLALPLIGQGELLSEDGSEPAGAALAVAGLAPIALEAKEGLALVNGTQGMLAVGIRPPVADLARATSPRRCRWRRSATPLRRTAATVAAARRTGRVGVEPASAARRLIDPVIAS